MKKQWVLLGVMAVILAALIIGTIFIKNTDKSEENDNESTIDVFSLEKDDVYAFSFTDSVDDPVSFHFDEDQWIYDGFEQATLNETAVDGIVEELCDLKASEILSDVNASEFGFDEPSYIFTVTDSLGNTTKISFGIQNSITKEYYFIMNDDKTMIYVNDGAVIYACEDNADNIIVSSDENDEAE